jgi:hypothetical protein
VDVLDQPLPPIGARSVPPYIKQLNFGPGNQPEDERQLREMKTFAISLLCQHGLDVDVLLALKRETWRSHMNEPTLRRLYEEAYPPQSQQPASDAAE